MAKRAKAVASKSKKKAPKRRRVPRRSSSRAVLAAADATLGPLRARRTHELSWDEVERALDDLAFQAEHLRGLPRPKALEGLLLAFDLPAAPPTEEAFVELTRHLGLLRDDDGDPRSEAHVRALWSALRLFWLRGCEGAPPP